MLFDKNNRFNLANLITFGNIASGVVAIHFILNGEYLIAIVLAWIAGGLDILDGKVARRFKLSTEFGVQLDSYADFISFVVMPSFLLYYAITEGASDFTKIIVGVIFLIYIISGLRRLIEFNIKVEVGEAEKYFTGVPTPLGAILLWLLYLTFSYNLIPNPYIISTLVLLIAWSLNSRIKIPHP
ncbi:MAG: phosphatidylserine synthase [Epsilonproteobacteria bacterium]|nr:phosphatidylserine synthase [Campylobacterota bacterium]